jgi:uncharacterized protein
MKRSLPLLLGFLLVAPLAGRRAWAVQIELERPGDREFVRDLADMIDASDEEQIRKLSGKLLKAKTTPILVVTIRSMAEHGGEGMRTETFTRFLFDQWGLGHEKRRGQPWNTGILLLVSKKDRKARIELGAGWGRKKDALCSKIMKEQIVARFKKGDFSGGIRAGVESLDKMARGLKLPTRARPWWHWGLVVAFIGLAIFTGVSLYRRGAKGYAWIFWGVVLAILGYLLYSFLTRRGSFSGGSFGGGFSGGGGATGSW